MGSIEEGAGREDREPEPGREAKLVYTPSGKRDIDGISDGYENERIGLGLEFITAVDKVLKKVQAFPLGRPLVTRAHRRVRIKPFPYHLYYAFWRETVIVVALVHVSRDDRVWKKRLGIS